MSEDDAGVPDEVRALRFAVQAAYAELERVTGELYLTDQVRQEMKTYGLARHPHRGSQD